MPTRNQAAKLPSIGLSIWSSGFLAGETITRKLRRAMVLADYAPRHVVTKGSFRVAFSDSSDADEVTSVGGVFPQVDKEGKLFTVTALEDMEYYCVVPDGKNNLVYETFQVAKAHTVPQGKLAFVFGESYTVNEKLRQGVSVLACVNSAVSIQADKTCTVVEFSVGIP